LNRLEGDLTSSGTGVDAGAGVAGRGGSVRIWWGKTSDLGDSGSAGSSEDVVALNSLTIGAGIEIGHNSQWDIGEAVLLNQDLGTHAGVDTGGWAVGEAAAVDVTGTETEGWETGVDVIPAVVVVSNLELASIFGGVAVGVTDERALPVVMELVP